MDLARILVRVVFAWCFVLVLLRVSGKRTIKQGDLASFVVALVLGDLFDDVFWSEVPVSQFVVGAGTLAIMHVLTSIAAGGRAVQGRRRGIPEGR